MPVYTDEFLESLPISVAVAGGHLVDTGLKHLEKSTHAVAGDLMRSIVEVHAVVNAFLEANSLPVMSALISSEPQKLREELMKALRSLEKKWDVDLLNNHASAVADRAKAIFKKGFSYELTAGDLDRVQQLINELRTEIAASDLFEAPHKQRLLQRLERLQSEMHKRMSDLDRLYGLVGDLGVVTGKFGRDAKPFVDRIRELLQIGWRTQARAEELPSDSQPPLIGTGRTEEDGSSSATEPDVS